MCRNYRRNIFASKIIIHQKGKLSSVAEVIPIQNDALTRWQLSTYRATPVWCVATHYKGGLLRFLYSIVKIASHSRTITERQPSLLLPSCIE